MKPEPDPLDLDRLLERAEHEPEASRELDFLCDLTAAAEQAGLDSARAAPPRRRVWLLPAAAALLALLAGALWWLRDDEPVRERLAWEAPPAFTPAELRGGGELAAAFAHAMEPYSRADWPAARTALVTFLDAHPTHAAAHFYRGVVARELGAHDEARAAFERAASAGEGWLADHARLRLALLALELGQDDEARRTLAPLAAGAGPFAAPAQELLDGSAR